MAGVSEMKTVEGLYLTEHFMDVADYSRCIVVFDIYHEQSDVHNIVLLMQFGPNVLKRIPDAITHFRGHPFRRRTLRDVNVEAI